MIAIDSNLIVRLAVGDDEVQQGIALAEVQAVERVVLPLLSICEAAWVLRRSYGVSRAELAAMLRKLLGIPNADFDEGAVAAGLELLDAGGDFADGVIAYQARSRGADTLVSFDHRAVTRLAALGYPARLPGTRA